MLSASGGLSNDPQGTEPVKRPGDRLNAKARFANERAAIPGLSSIDDPAPLTSQFWKLRAQRVARATLAASK